MSESKSPSPQDDRPGRPLKGASPAQIAALVDRILDAATLEEKVAMMSGQGFEESMRRTLRWGGEPYRAGGGCERLGVPVVYFTDGPRGVVRGNSTCFPVSIARGATFDPDLERRVGEVIGIEARAQGCNLYGGVCVNLLRHPAWGRAQESYGEDPHLLGEMGAALAQGVQAHNVMATVKHFALNSVENARFRIDVRVDARTLREVYLPHFRRVLDAGCATVMSAYNKVNGEYCGQNRGLLTGILRDEWGFEGFVHSDWGSGVYEVYGVTAGLDVENPEPKVFGANLLQAVADGHVDPAAIDTACRRIMTTTYRFACAEDPLPDYPLSLVACDAHRAVALEVAQKSAVLLKNNGVLPLDRDALGVVAVLGRLSDLANTGDRGSSYVQPPDVVTPLAGLREALGPAVDILEGGERDIAEAASLAARADAVIVVVGLTWRDEGEYVRPAQPATAEHPAQPAIGGDRLSLRLGDAQLELIAAATQANPNTVVVVVAGSAVLMDPWSEAAGAILQTFYGGMEGGRALAQLLLGELSPSGKLPFSVPKAEADLPFFDREADSIEYGPLHGYTLLDAHGKAAAFPFGFGLSYTTFAYRALAVRRLNDRLEATVAVTNAGQRPADEVVQLYVGFPGIQAERPRKLLRAFRRVSIGAGETRIVNLTVPLETLGWWDDSIRGWRLEPGEHRVFVGGSSAEAEKTAVSFIL